MPQRFEISIHTRPPDPTGQPVLPRSTGRIRLILHTMVVMLVTAVLFTVGIALGTAVAVLIAALVAIAFVGLFVRGAISRIRTNS